jgi:hypothetical protein
VSASDVPPSSKLEPVVVQPGLVVLEIDEHVVVTARFLLQELNALKRLDVSLPSLVRK